MPILIAVVGMTGAGKSTVVELFMDAGYSRVYFGKLTLDEIKKRGLDRNEKNEKMIREGFRKEHGMAAFAILNLKNIETALKKGNVVIDGLYSWEEYLVLKEKFPQMKVVAVYAPPELRYERLAHRKERIFTCGESKSRDEAEIENSHKAGPIAMADFTIMNTTDRKNMERQFQKIIGELEHGKVIIK